MFDIVLFMMNTAQPRSAVRSLRFTLTLTVIRVSVRVFKAFTGRWLRTYVRSASDALSLTCADVSKALNRTMRYEDIHHSCCSNLLQLPLDKETKYVTAGSVRCAAECL